VNDRGAVWIKARLAAALDDRQAGTEPARVMTAAGKAEDRRDPVAAVDYARLTGSRPPGENAMPRPKDLERR
jgi:hypothetical protein